MNTIIPIGMASKNMKRLAIISHGNIINPAFIAKRFIVMISIGKSGIIPTLFAIN
jgi:hypothetical protein